MLDPYIPGNSPIHKLNPRVKFPIALGFFLMISMIDSKAYPIYVITLSILISFQVLSEIKFTYFIKRSLLLSPFLLAVFPLPFISGEPIRDINILSVTIPISMPGLERALMVIFKATLSLQTAILLVSTTNFNGLLDAMQFLNIPKILIQIYGMMWRYLFVITDEVQSIISARNARSGSVSNSHGGGNLFWRAKIAGNMMGSLIIRSLERSERIYYAMLSRGYNGAPHSVYIEKSLNRNDKIILISVLILLIFLTTIGLIF